jgi:hypothetical protein
MIGGQHSSEGQGTLPPIRSGHSAPLERVDAQEGVLEVRIRAEGLVSLVSELRQDAKRMAA